MIHRPRLEPLESRRLCSISLVNHIITITGTGGADKVSVQLTLPPIVVRTSPTGILPLTTSTYRATLNGVSKTFPVADVKGVSVSTGDGNDSVMLGNLSPLVFAPSGGGAPTIAFPIGIGAILVPATVHGGNGADTITGGNANDHLYGEAGNDRIVGGNGNDFISGGGGNDTLGLYWNEAGNDSINGGDGNDNINAGYGNDTVHGGCGNDTVNGYAGADVVYGGPGADHFFLNLDPKPSQAKDFIKGQDINDGGTIYPVPL